MGSNPLLKSAGIATILQLLMVFLGRNNPGIAAMFPAVGTGLGGLAGLLFGMWSKGATTGAQAGGGAIAGGLSGLIGSVVSMALGSVPLGTVGVATVSTAVAGAVGGFLGKFLGGAKTSA